MYKALMIEDHKEVRDFVKEYFDHKEIEVIEAQNGYEGLAILDDTIDIILLDIMMPGIDGYEVCKQIRSQYNTLIVFISALSEDENQLKAYEYGADDYITKPFKPSLLYAKCLALLKRNKKIETNQLQSGKVILDLDKHILVIEENNIVLNVQSKNNTTIKLSEMYVWDDSASLGGIYVEPKIDLDENGNGTITFKNDDLKNVKTLIGSNDPLDWTKIKQIEMYFVFCLDETEIYDSKSAYIPVEISKTPAPVETEKPKTIETVKKETKATTKNTQSKAVKTGDNTNITLYTSLLIISVIVVAGTIVLRKKKS
jgi:CheY-like chemotaxis protein